MGLSLVRHDFNIKYVVGYCRYSRR